MELEKLNIVTGIDTSGDYIPGISGMVVKLVNGWEASIITGSYLHGGRSGLYEIAPIGPDGEMRHEEVQGYLTEKDVEKMVIELATR